MAKLDVGSLGGYIREQRGHAEFSLRQLADAAGVSNPYLSQIERGLRKPSAEILQQIAKGLRISAETLYVRAGILDEHDGDQHEFSAAVHTDALLTERQKRVLLDIYESFRRENAASAGRAAPDTGDLPAVAAKKANRRAATKTASSTTASRRTPAQKASATRATRKRATTTTTTTTTDTTGA